MADGYQPRMYERVKLGKIRAMRAKICVWTQRLRHFLFIMFFSPGLRPSLS